MGTSSLHYSIIRRSIAVIAFFVLGHGIHYLLLLTGNRLLAPEAFGVFYAGNSLVNVILTPGIVVSFLFAQYFAAIAGTMGKEMVAAELWRVLRTAVVWGAGFIAPVYLLLVIAGWFAGVQAWEIVLLVPAISFSAFIFETIRSAFQGLLRFSWFSAAWIGWNVAQYALATAGFYYTRTVWSGFAGILVATLLTIAVMLLALARWNGPLAPAVTHRAPLKLIELLPLLLGYGLFTIAANADVLLGYLVLDRAPLGTYASSALLAKALVTATQPIAQIVLPVLVTRAAARSDGRFAVAKGIMLSLALGVTGWGGLYLLAPYACSSQFGLQNCDMSLLRLLALGAIPMGMYRVLIVANCAWRKLGSLLLPFVCLLAFSTAALALPVGVEKLAGFYVVLSWSLLILYGGAVLPWRHATRRQVERGESAHNSATRG